MHIVTTTAVATLLLTLATPAAALDLAQEKCQATIAKEGGRFLKAVLKERAKCADKNLKTTASCDVGKRNAKLAKAETKLRSALQKKCVDAFPATLDDENLASIGFPGKCADADGSDFFTGADLQDCILDTHAAIAANLFDAQYGSNGSDAVVDFATRTGDPALGKDLARCQKEIAKNGLKHALTVQKEIRKCRDDLLDGSLSGFAPRDCGDNPVETKPREKIAKSHTKANDKIVGKCPDAIVADPNMDVCDVGGGRQLTGADAASCIVDAHRTAIDDPDQSALAEPYPVDAIDIEYALGAICGDGIVNDPALPSVFAASFHVGPPPEECDRADDAACPGNCGAPDGSFPCQCTDSLRLRVIEHDNADLDIGWTPSLHDSRIVEGAGYMLDVHDCDGPGGPDTACTIGPSCALAPHGACVSDADCPGGGDFCRKTSLAVGPHCNDDVQTPCDTNAECPAPGDFCRKTQHGPPLPISSGNIAAYCLVNIFSEDVTGTTDLGTGDAQYRLRQRTVAHLGSGTLNQPCPVCGGFCAGESGSGSAGPGERTLCAADSDCPASSACITDAVCSYGPNEDEPCRRTGPFGNPTPFFGTPSVDCPPRPGNDVSNGGVDILYDSATTGTLFTPPTFTCNAAGFGGNKCILGSEVGKACAADSDCAGGGVGGCAPQCFCPSIGGAPQKPNDCQAACHGGSNDYAPCSAASDCPGGLCEAASCRVAAGRCTGGSTIATPCAADSDCGVDGICGDPDSSFDGFCPASPPIGRCSVTTTVFCAQDSHCRPSGGCSFCESGNSEICVFKQRDCFPGAGYTRAGVPGYPDRVDVAHFCFPSGGPSSLDNIIDVPAPGALTLPVTLDITP